MSFGHAVDIQVKTPYFPMQRGQRIFAAHTHPSETEELTRQRREPLPAVSVKLLVAKELRVGP